jgi:hypothetical protein
VAGRRGRIVGYVLGRTFFTPPVRRSFLAPRARFIGDADHAVDAEDALDVHSALYSALATAWVNAGCLSHYVQVAATDARTAECWQALGFGCGFVTAVRDTGALVPADWPGDRRRARPEDLDTIMGFIDALHRFEAAAPMSRPYLPETSDERAVHARMLDDPTCAHWIAVASAMAWAREAGHGHCLLHFTAANLVSRRFWLGHGFRPLEYWLHHRLDERIVSAERELGG